MRELERNFKDDLYRFYDDPNPASNDWPSWCYNFTKKNNPVRQDVSGTTDSGNVFAIESSGNEMYRAIQGQCHDLVLPHRPVPRRNPQNENRDQGSVIPQRDHSELFQSVYENGLSRSTGSTSEQPDFPQPSGPLRHPLPEELAPLPHCYTCGKNIQVQKKQFRPFLLRFYTIQEAEGEPARRLTESLTDVLIIRIYYKFFFV